MARTIPLADLHQDPANVRRHGERNREAVRGSIADFGWLGATIVEKGTGRILSGNASTAEAQARGYKEAVVVEYDPATQVVVLEADLHGVDATRFAIAANQTALLAEWDTEGLASMLRDLDAAGLRVPGFDDEALAEWAKQMEAPTEADWGSGMGGLPSEDRQPFQQMTFTVADAQVDLIKRALTQAGRDGCRSALNDNSNGNALAALAAAYLGEEAP